VAEPGRRWNHVPGWKDPAMATWRSYRFLEAEAVNGEIDLRDILKIHEAVRWSNAELPERSASQGCWAATRDSDSQGSQTTFRPR